MDGQQVWPPNKNIDVKEMDPSTTKFKFEKKIFVKYTLEHGPPKSMRSCFKRKVV